MISVLLILLFILGCFIGSFLNVVVDRLPFNKSIVYPPSHCDSCKHRLLYFDLLPVISFLYLKGRCRYCKVKLSLYYPAVEIITGFLFVLAVSIAVDFNYSLIWIIDPWYILYLFSVVSVLIIIFFIDLKYGIIPFNVIVTGLGIVSVRYILISIITHTFLINYLLTGIISFLLFFLLFLVTKERGIGFGDVFFSLFMGYLLGYPNVILGLYLAFLTGAVISLILVLAKRKKLRGGTIPFGPFLTFGTLISLFWGQIIIEKILLYFHL